MKLTIAIAVLGMIASTSVLAVSTEDLKAINSRMTSAECSRIDQWNDFVDRELRNRGLANSEPENLVEDDRMFNAQAHILIWSLRIGCNNPYRYARK